MLPAAVLAELSTNKGYGHAGWHAPVVLGADSAYGAAALHARILVPLALSCASGVALHAGPREQCSPTTAGVHQGPCSQGYASVGRTRSGLRLLTRSLAQMRRRCAAMHMDDLGATCRTLRVKIRTSDSIALGLTCSSLWDHGVSVHAAEPVQARVRWRILLEEILLCRVASTIAPESEISPSMASRAWMPCKLVCSGRSRPVPLKSPRTLRKRGQPAHFAQEGLLKESCSM